MTRQTLKRIVNALVPICGGVAIGAALSVRHFGEAFLYAFVLLGWEMLGAEARDSK